MTNQELALLFKHMAAAYTIKDDKKYRFQIIAYQKAADTIEKLNTEAESLYKENALTNLPGIGPTIKSHIEELFSTGRVSHFDTILKTVPSCVFPLLDIPSFGPKRAIKLVTAFSLENPLTVIEDIERLAIDGKIAPLETFGEKSQKDILHSISEYKLGKTKSGRMVLPYAVEQANKIISYMKKCPEVLDIYPLGSLRRMVSTIGDIDIAVSSNFPEKVIDHFVKYPQMNRITEKGNIYSAITISGNKQVDLKVLKPENLGSLLQYFTGSKQHNIKLREFALKNGFSLSEHGIKIKNMNNELREFSSEVDFYKFIGLPWIPPELREDTGEIEAALKNKLPKLVQLQDIKGDLHIHSNYPIEPSHDLGNNSMQEMLDKAKGLRYEFLGFSEHNPGVTNHTKSQIYSILSKRKDKIEQLKKSNKSIRIINLLETDILASGELALDDKSLELVDALIVSIHSSFGMSKEKMTQRILAGLSHPKAKIFAHPTGRLINERTGYEIDWEMLFDFITKHNKALEINSWPSRLDLPDTLVKYAKGRGVKFIINTDSHATTHMDNMFYGVSVARRGWCEKSDILNTYTSQKFISWITQ